MQGKFERQPEEDRKGSLNIHPLPEKEGQGFLKQEEKGLGKGKRSYLTQNQMKLLNRGGLISFCCVQKGGQWCQLVLAGFLMKPSEFLQNNEINTWLSWCQVGILQKRGGRQHSENKQDFGKSCSCTVLPC